MFFHRHIGSALICLAATLVACTPQAVREAQDVVAQADSLWAAGQMYGREAGDSATLAQAYKTLNTKLSSLSPQLSTTFAHACYHYGRLLRERENPAAAMEAFIHATHSRTHDYHILGRVYSNMGDICHLAGEFPLSYDMFERSANNYLKNGDTLLYYYGLNNMAYELAEQGKKESAIYLVSQIEKSCTNKEILTKTLETRAEACLYAHQYDSILYYTNLLYSNNSREPNIFLLRAKAFTFLEQKDSAVYYAQHVLSLSNELFDKNSAMYILTHNDDSKDREDVRKISADRSDVQKLIEIQQGKLSQAVQLLEQDLHRKPDYRWLYAIIATLLIVGTSITFYISRKRKKHKLISQQVEELEQEASKLQEKHNDLTRRYMINQKRLIEDIENKCATLHNNKNLTKELSWSHFETMCSIMDEQFYLFATKLRKKQLLNETETRLCVLVLLDLNRTEISETLPYALNSVGKLKDHTAKLLGTKGKNLREFLLKMVTEG